MSGSRRSSPGLALVALAAAATGSCRHPLAGADRPLPIGAIEERYQDVRALRDEIDVTRSRGSQTTPDGVAIDEIVVRYDAARDDLARALAAGAAPPLSPEDDAALAVMRRTLADALVAEPTSGTGPTAGAGPTAGTGPTAGAEVDCRYDPEAIAAGERGSEALSRRIYACFSRAAHSLAFDGEPTDRLTILGRLATEEDPDRRRELWLALAPVWAAIDGGPGAASPYRTLVRAHAARLRERGEALGGSVRGIGVEPARMEAWLEQVLARWREIGPPAPLEPWDFAYRSGGASRRLRAAVPLASLRAINDRFYADLGADPAPLRVQYDLEVRASKDPVAFTTFGRRPRRGPDGWIPGEPWVFATYRIGGADNLLELLHETGHAVHIAAIRTRPAFTDWPDSDIFTEALAELAALDLWEADWQQRYLGTRAPTGESIRAKYAGIAMDVAWALFEVRVFREPERDPNEIWTGIASEYFGIAPHPDLAWWAIRGQLVDSPGYMMNYAAGAILAADLRARLRELRGPRAGADPGWYAAASAQLYRFGLEKPSEQVIEDFLGRPVSPQALLDDMARAGAPEPLR